MDARYWFAVFIGIRGLNPVFTWSQQLDLERSTAGMAQKVIVSLVDDLDGKKADETVDFTLDGTSYQIDLSSGERTQTPWCVTSYIEAPAGEFRQASGKRPRWKRRPVGLIGNKTRPSGNGRGSGNGRLGRGRIPANVWTPIPSRPVEITSEAKRGKGSY